MSFNKDLVRRLKKEFKVEKDQELAEVFNVSPFIFSSWKRSKGKLIEEVVKFGVENRLNFNSVFHGKKEEKEGGVPILLADDLFSYYLNPEEKTASLSRYNIPTVRESELGFQVISQNMEPLLTVSSLVFGSEISRDEMRENEVYVLSVLKKGIYITRFAERRVDSYIFKNDNTRFPDFVFNVKDIVSVFKVNEILVRL